MAVEKNELENLMPKSVDFNEQAQKKKKKRKIFHTVHSHPPPLDDKIPTPFCGCAMDVPIINVKKEVYILN